MSLDILPDLKKTGIDRSPLLDSACQEHGAGVRFLRNGSATIVSTVAYLFSS